MYFKIKFEDVRAITGKMYWFGDEKVANTCTNTVTFKLVQLLNESSLIFGKLIPILKICCRGSTCVFILSCENRRMPLI